MCLSFGEQRWQYLLPNSLSVLKMSFIKIPFSWVIKFSGVNSVISAVFILLQSLLISAPKRFIIDRSFPKCLVDKAKDPFEPLAVYCVFSHVWFDCPSV